MNIKKYTKYLIDSNASLENVNDVLDSMERRGILKNQKYRRKLYFFFTRMRSSKHEIRKDGDNYMVHQIRPMETDSNVNIPVRIVSILFDYLLLDEFDEYPVITDGKEKIKNTIEILNLITSIQN